MIALASKKTLIVGTDYKNGNVEVPAALFRDRSLAVMEVLVEYLHDDQKLAYHEIAKLLNRDDRTIWTVYHRAKQKRRSR
jgi:hypothetical protein